MDNGILHETRPGWGRFVAAAVLLFGLCGPALTSPLFEDDSVLDIRLSGPLQTLSHERKYREHSEYPFTLTIDGTEIPIMARVRGKSRTSVCPFPPIRLRLEGDVADGTAFAGQKKLKLVTHCFNNKAHYENNTLDEYTAYLIFNRISDIGYRVRLLRITYEDTDNRLKHLDRQYFGFVIESTAGLAERVGGTVEDTDGVLYSRLNAVQAARINVFQYLIANSDWSFVTANNDDKCCHNIDLIELNGELFPVPYDFDLSGIVNASYAKPPEGVRIRNVTSRVYRGYCSSPIETVAAELDNIVALRDDIMAIVANSPVVGNEDVEDRTEYVDRFFKEATDKRDKLVKRFNRDCIG